MKLINKKLKKCKVCSADLDVSVAVGEAFSKHRHHITMVLQQRRQLLTKLQLTLSIFYLHNRSTPH